uniref:Uncharacterized protein n=1 Tax=Ciona savignyi TaxID=51511 RepID=H2YI50_CIOSA
MQEAYTQLPNFWLIIQIKDDCANVFFHRRNSTKVLTTVKAEHARMFVAIVENARSACRATNQILLLKELHDTHISRSLLIENPVEDIWKNPSYNHSS